MADTNKKIIASKRVGEQTITRTFPAKMQKELLKKGWFIQGKAAAAEEETTIEESEIVETEIKQTKSNRKK